VIKVLAVIAAAGIVISAVCMGLVISIYGPNLDWSDFNVDRFDGDAGLTQYEDYWQGEEVTRQFDWPGGRDLDVGMPADVTYVTGEAGTVTVTGPENAVERFYVEDGNLRLEGWAASNTFADDQAPDFSERYDRPPRLTITVTAPLVTRFDLSGSETLNLPDYDHDVLEIEASGAAQVTGAGRAQLLVLDLSGGADADLTGLQLSDAEIEMSANTTAIVAPTARAEYDLSGGSRLTLRSRPRRIVEDISGSARVYELGEVEALVAAEGEGPSE
jgi:hypothetical protein